MTTATSQKSRKSGRAENHLQHGRHALSMGTLSPAYAHITRTANAVRRELETVVLALRGEITLHDAATVQTACRFERHAQLAQKWVRENPTLPIVTRLAISRDIAKASSERDRCIRLLGLDVRNTVNPELRRIAAILDEHDRQQAEASRNAGAPLDPEAASGTPDAPQSIVGDSLQSDSVSIVEESLSITEDGQTREASR